MYQNVGQWPVKGGLEKEAERGAVRELGQMGEADFPRERLRREDIEREVQIGEVLLLVRGRLFGVKPMTQQGRV